MGWGGVHYEGVGWGGVGCIMKGLGGVHYEGVGCVMEGWGGSYTGVVWGVS